MVYATREDNPVEPLRAGRPDMTEVFDEVEAKSDRKPVAVFVCGPDAVVQAAWDESTVQLVPDVHEFEGHVACSSLTESELVIPIVSADEVVAVLDIDSVKRDDVSAADVEGLTPLVDFLGQNWNVWE